MASILMASGFKNLESLEEFSTRFPNVDNRLDKELQKIWICHKCPEEIPKFEEMSSLVSEDYHSLLNKIKKKVNSSEDFFLLMTEFSALSIFNKIYYQFQKQLTTYLFTKCYLFYNWGISAFEPVIDHFEIHMQIKKSQKMLLKKKQRKIIKNLPNCSNLSKKDNLKSREKSVDLFEEPVYSTVQSKSKISYKTVKEAVQNAEKFFEISKNSNNPYQETFNFKKILYDMKQKPEWPRNHVLSKNSIEDLIIFIVQIPVTTSFYIEDKLLNDHKNWVMLKELLGRFLKQHEVINKNNGYGRILKKHLKTVKSPTDRRLFPIPKSVICSYVADILRRVLPFELFSSNRLRKDFLRRVLRIVNGMKGQNFIWYQLLRLIVKNKSNLPWCSELGDNYTQSQVILKLFKFLVIHYIFDLLKNNFYITETGSSGFGLRFYRKSDMESRSFICINHLLKSKQIRPLRRQDHEEETIERKWLETGKMNEEDVNRKLKKIMSSEYEYKQPIAHVRFLPKTDEGDELRIITNLVHKMPKESNGKYKKLEKLFAVRLAWRKKKLFFVKLLLEFLVDKYGFGIRAEPYNPVLEATWKRVVHLQETYGKLFFIKADISDAFGSVKYNILTEILRKTLEENSGSDGVRLKKIIEWKKTRWKIEKAVRFSFSNRPKENSIMIHRSHYLHHRKKINQSYDSKFLRIIKQVVMMQRVEMKGKVFRLIKGLAQGNAGRFSPQLCEIYYSSMDRLCFRDYINSSDSVLLRAVDDYFFITSNLEKAKKFLELVRTGFDDYGVRFNNSKLKSNLIEDVQQVLYLGLVFNFDDMSVKPNYSKYQRIGLLSTINLFDQWGSSHFNKEIFLRRRSLQIQYLKLHPIVLNNVQGNLKIIRQTIFEACLVQSLRVITLANYLYSGSAKNDLAVYKVLVKSCNQIKGVVVRRSRDILSRDELRWLFFFAASTILRKWSGQFRLLFLIIRFRLQQCEKAFIDIGRELLLGFLKADILDCGYWRRVNGVFMELGKMPKFVRR